MEQITLFDLQDDLLTGSLCDDENGLCSENIPALVLREAKRQELREAYTRTLAPDAYRPSADEGKLPGTSEEIAQHLTEVRERRLSDVDLSVCKIPAIEFESPEEAPVPAPYTKRLILTLKEKIRSFFSASPTWFDRKKPEPSAKRSFQLSAFAAIGVFAICLSLIVGGSILVTHGENANNRLKKEISQMNAQIAELQSDIHLTQDTLLIRELAVETCGMIGEEYVRTEILALEDQESVEIYPDGKAEGVGLSSLLSAIGIKK